MRIARIAAVLTALALGLFVHSRAAGQVITYFHNDASGTPLLATDGSGNVVWRENYRPYGEKLLNPPAAADNKLGFAGQPFDSSTGLSYMGARYYDPVLGRFLGVDPAEVKADDVSGFNRYAYAANNPYRYVDRDGHSPVDVVFLLYDLGKLGVAVYSGADVGGAAIDVAISAVGVLSPVPGAGVAIKAARAAERSVEVARTVERTVEAGRTAELGVVASKDTVGGLRAAGKKDAHHVIQDAAVRDVPGYNTNAAPGIQLPGPSNTPGTPHNIATEVQRQAGGGTYAAERRIGYKAMRRAGVSEGEARGAIRQADDYFGSLGVGLDTVTRVPGNR